MWLVPTFIILLFVKTIYMHILHFQKLLFVNKYYFYLNNFPSSQIMFPRVTYSRECPKRCRRIQIINCFRHYFLHMSLGISSAKSFLKLLFCILYCITSSLLVELYIISLRLLLCFVFLFFCLNNMLTRLLILQFFTYQ